MSATGTVNNGSVEIAVDQAVCSVALHFDFTLPQPCDPVFEVYDVQVQLVDTEEEVDVLFEVYKPFPLEEPCLNYIDMLFKLPRPLGGFIGKTTARHNKGTSQDVAVYGFPEGTEDPVCGEEVPLGINLECYSRFATIGDNKWVYFVQNGTCYEITAAECD